MRQVAFLFAAALYFLLGTTFPSSIHARQTLEVIPPSVQGRQLADPSSLRIRFSWGGGTEQTWQGTVAVANGHFSEVKPLGLLLDAPTAVAIENGQPQGNLKIQHRLPTNYGGADVTLTGTEAQIAFSISSLENPDVIFEKTVSFSELVSGVVGGSIDQLGNRCSFTRVPGDQVDVAFDRSHLVFEPDERFEFSVAPKWTRLATKNANAKVTITSVKSGRTGRPLMATSAAFEVAENGSAPPQKFSIKVPEKEGVYNIEIVVEPAWFQASFNTKKIVLKRTIQFVVLSKQRPVANKDQNWRQISTHNPVDESAAFSGWPPLANFGRQPLRSIGNDLRQSVVVENQNMMKLLPGGWQAIPISVDQPNRPHVVELEYIAENEMVLGLSLLEPDANGQIPLYGFDSGVFIPNSLVKGDLNLKVQRHRLTVWPKTKTPYLLVANRQAINQVTVGMVNVFAGPERLEPSVPSQVSSEAENLRKFMAFYEIPLFADNFGAREAEDSSVAEPLDDWQMFYEGADRMIQYLKANSYRGAFMTVVSDGSSIYPSKLLSSSPKHDNGTFFSQGQDPIKKDVLEMLFRMFEREGLVLVPTLSLSAPLPEVERAIIASAGVGQGLKMISLNQESPDSGGGEKLPIYNPLSRQVQRSVTRVVEELADRFKRFDAFSGVAITCRSDNYTLLPGRNWGYDATTVKQFVQSQADLNEVPGTFGGVKELLLGSHREQWLDWRAQQMTRWYEDMAATMRRSIPDAELYLAPIDLYLNEEMASAMSPSLHTSNDFGQVMLHMGFMTRLVEGIDQNGKDSGVVMLNTHRFAPDQTLARQRVDLEARNSKQVKEYFGKANYCGDLFSHRISWAHFEQLQANSPFGAQQNPLMRLQQMSPVEQFNRERFVQSIKDRDARMLIDGGWLLTMGQESSLLEMMSVFGQLPDEKFVDVATERFDSLDSIPIAVRELKRGSDAYFYVVNASPWPMEVKLWVNANSKAGANIVSLSNDTFVVKPWVSKASTSTDNPNGSLIQLVVQIEPFGLVGARSDDPSMHVADFDFEFPDDVEKTLRKHVYLLQSKLIKSESSDPINVIDNSGFEVNGQATLVGWDSGEQSTKKVRLDSTSGAPDERGATGRASVAMTGDAKEAVWLRSNTFKCPETGRLSISVWLKTEDPKLQPPLRLSVEGQTATGGYYRFGSVGSLSPNPDSNQIGSEWKRFAVHFDDLPTEEMTGIRVGFDLMGPGQISIDNVQVFDRWFDKNDAKAITQMLASAGPLLANKNSYDRCRRLLEGYWTSFLDHHISTVVADAVEPEQRQSTGQMLGPVLENETMQLGEETERGQKKIPMFRRLRNMVPQRNNR